MSRVAGGDLLFGDIEKEREEREAEAIKTREAADKARAKADAAK